MRFGVFTPPVHQVGQSPSVLFEHDLRYFEEADRLGFDEAWIGEHHSGGWEIVPSPELFIAAASQRTSRIMLGTGVVAVPHQHPFILAEKAVMLDHLSRGRLILGIGPGGLPIDAQMLGEDANEQRRMMEESVEAMLALLRCDGPVNRQTDWFALHDAELNLGPYTQPRFEIGVSSLASPAGPRLAGKYGLSLFSIGATTSRGFDFLASSWEILSQEAAAAGHEGDPASWRLMCPMHIAETEEEARRQARVGCSRWIDHYGSLLGLATMLKDLIAEPDLDRRVDRLNESGFGVIGTPEMAIAKIRSLQEAAPGFGTVLITNFGWATPNGRHDLESLEIIARRVIPEFRNHLAAQVRAHTRLTNAAAEVQRVMATARQQAAMGDRDVAVSP